MNVSIRQNWFWPVAVCLLAMAWQIARITPASATAAYEGALIVDVLITLPLLYFFCYRKAVSAKIMVLRIVALQCFGIWLASKIVPASGQQMLPALVWLRYAGLAVLILIEVKLFIVMVKLVSKPGATRSDLEDSGMPPLLAKWALLEARFWRWLFAFFKK